MSQVDSSVDFVTQISSHSAPSKCQKLSPASMSSASMSEQMKEQTSVYRFPEVRNWLEAGKRIVSTKSTRAKQDLPRLRLHDLQRAQRKVQHDIAHGAAVLVGASVSAIGQVAKQIRGIGARRHARRQQAPRGRWHAPWRKARDPPPE